MPFQKSGRNKKKNIISAVMDPPLIRRHHVSLNSTASATLPAATAAVGKLCLGSDSRTFTDKRDKKKQTNKDTHLRRRKSPKRRVLVVFYRTSPLNGGRVV